MMMGRNHRICNQDPAIATCLDLYAVGVDQRRAKAGAARARSTDPAVRSQQKGGETP